ncbi:MAG: ribonuclease H family protein [Dysgonamonadaceae bacterium]|jgi:ribonuclease HI|nr:ribonuclease H family protein [Dysgonamonadaceae bacterium]
MPKRKYYVVWKGVETGIYDSWDDCKKQVDGFENALYKSFAVKEEAVEAFRSEPSKYFRKHKKATPAAGKIIKESISVDAACSGNPGRMEYRGVRTATGEELFHAGPFEQATNNIGEFLAIVHGLALLQKQQLDIPVYSDSKNGMLWVKQKKCKTKLQPVEENAPVFDLIRRAETWLHNNTYSNSVVKWDTKNFGEIPADFGRK